MKHKFTGSSKGRIAGFDPAHRGSSPCPVAKNNL